jgi:hypothetical protein
MRHQKLLLWTNVLMLSMFVLAGCSADCFFAGTVKAWVDNNEDGMWDPDEPPLSGVQFFIDDVRNHNTNVGDGAISNETGETLVYVWLPGCPKVRFEIYAEPPAGYRPTTQPRIPARENDKGPFLFGFVPLNE